MGNANILTFLRAILMIAGTLLVSRGVVNQDQLSGLVDALMTAGGAVFMAGSLALSVWRNYQTHHAIVVAAATGTPVQVQTLAVPTVANAIPSPTAAVDLAKANKAA